MLDKLENILNSIQAGKVLDIASGAGDFIGFIKNMRNIESVIAVDELEKMGEIVKKDHPEEMVQFMRMNANHLEFEDSSFDTVCISNSLHHLSDLNLAIREAIRVLKKGGHLVINEMCCDGLTPSQLSHDMMHRFVAKLDQKRGMSHQPTMSKKEINQIIQNTGLREIDNCQYSFSISDEQIPRVIEKNNCVLNRQMEIFKDDTDISEIRKEAEEIMEYMQKNGFASAESLLFVLQK